MQYEIKELSIGGILDQAVAITKNHFALLFGITLVLQLPFNLLFSFYMLSFLPAGAANVPPDQALQMQMEAAEKMQENLPVFFLLMFGFIAIAMPLTNAAMMHAIASKYLAKPTSVGNAFGRALRALLPLIGTGILWYLSIVAGLILCIIPGILFALWFALWTYVVVIEGVSGVAALKRSKFLMKGNIGTLIVLGFLIFFISGAVQFVSGLIPQQHAQVVVQAVVQQVVLVFSTAAFVVFYFSCRCKAENFDLALLAQSVGEEAPPSGSSMGDEAAAEF